MPTRGRSPIVIGPQPPPTHGASLVTSVVTGRLRERGECIVIDTAVAGTGPRYHLRRAARHLEAARTVWRRRAVATVYLTGVGGPALGYQLVIVVVGWLARVPMVYHHHSYAYLNRRSPAMAALAAVGGSSLHHVTLSSSMATTLRSRYPRATSGSVCSNVHFLPAPGARATPPTAGPLRIGHLSNLSIDKGLARVVAAYESVVAIGAPTELHLGGPAADEDAAAVLARAQRELTGVHYWGPLSRDQVGEFMSSIDLFVFPSTYRNEAQPLVVLEALLADVPTLALPVGCLGDLNDIDDRPVTDEAAFTAAVVDVAQRRQAADTTTGDAALSAWAARQLERLGDSGPTFLELLHA